MAGILKPDGQADADLVEVMFAPNRVEAEMAQGLLESEGVPSLLQATGVNGPQLGVGLSPQSPQRVMVRAEHADFARRLLAETGMEEGSDVDGLANAAHLDEAGGERAEELWGDRRLREDLVLVARCFRARLRDLPACSRHLNATAPIWRWTKVVAGAASLCPNN